MAKAGTETAMMDNASSKWLAVEKGGVLHISGEIDSTVHEEVRAALRAHVDKSAGEMFLDLGALDYMDSSGLAALLEIRKALHAVGRGMRITAVTPLVAKIFQITQVGRFFGLEEAGN